MRFMRATRLRLDERHYGPGEARSRPDLRVRTEACRCGRDSPPTLTSLAKRRAQHAQSSIRRTSDMRIAYLGKSYAIDVRLVQQVDQAEHIMRVRPPVTVDVGPV